MSTYETVQTVAALEAPFLTLSRIGNETEMSRGVDLKRMAATLSEAEFRFYITLHREIRMTRRLLK